MFALGVLLSGCERAEPEPGIKYGEFPFSLTYVDSNKKFELNDRIICKYGGINLTENGIYNAWEKSYSSGRKELLIKNLGDDKYLVFLDGDCDYYMGDLLPFVTFDIDSMNMALHHKDGSLYSEILIDREQAREKYGIEILGFTPSPPVVQRIE